MIGRWIIAVFLALFLSITGSASAAPVPPPPPPGGWLNLFKSITGQADNGIASLSHAVESGEVAAVRQGLSRISNQLNDAPQSNILTVAEQAALQRAITAHYTYQAAVSYSLEIPQSATRLTESVRPREVPPWDTYWVLLKKDLKKNAKGYLKQYACERAWNALTPQKKQQLPAPTTNAEKSVKAYVEAAAKYWESTVVGQYLAWNSYANGVFEKMEQLVSQGHLTAPPQAYVYYARYCMAPPIP
ncbi:hypothetical protein [Streptomyces sp. NPDC060031]|uniref:hypothetical protein n=1 Tax=Streptomyces sp. NPDC060031 TaxID=3347043 RepID=UPI00368093C9